MIESGGIGVISLRHIAAEDDRSLTGVVTATNDPGGFGRRGTSVVLTMLPGNMLQINGLMYCGNETDLSLYPALPCGA